jgi:hypothetical protein
MDWRRVFMRREVSILLGTVALGATLAWGGRVPEVLAAMEAFRLTDVEIQGLRYLTRSEVLKTMGIGAKTSVWGELDTWSERLLAHPLIRTVHVERRIPSGLLISLSERVPVALVATPTVEPVDAEGTLLPLDPAEHRLDLPLLEMDRAPAQGSRLLPEAGRELVGEVARLMSVDPSFLQMISEVRWGERRSLVARWVEPEVEFLLPLGVSQDRLREALNALAHAASNPSLEVPEVIDVRFADQVVVRRTTGK